MIIENILFIFIRTNKFTTGFSNMARINENTIGTIMFCAMYKIAKSADKPTKNMLALT
jgi:hypothetical protein